jgi:hypothetical protein
MFKARTTTALLLTIPALALGACGGSDSDSNSDEDKITSVIESVAADPVAICDHVTAADLREIGGKDACVRLGEESGDRASEITMDEVTVDGERATARFDDSEDGDTTIDLVKEDGDWKIKAG